VGYTPGEWRKQAPGDQIWGKVERKDHFQNPRATGGAGDDCESAPPTEEDGRVARTAGAGGWVTGVGYSFGQYGEQAPRDQARYGLSEGCRPEIAFGQQSDAPQRPEPHRGKTPPAEAFAGRREGTWGREGHPFQAPRESAATGGFGGRGKLIGYTQEMYEAAAARRPAAHPTPSSTGSDHCGRVCNSCILLARRPHLSTGCLLFESAVQVSECGGSVLRLFCVLCRTHRTWGGGGTLWRLCRE